MPDTVIGMAAVGKCDGCGRMTWNQGVIGTTDTMTQPAGGPCGGTFVAFAARPFDTAEARTEDMLRREDIAYRYWRYFYNNEVLPGDPAAEFEQEFRALGKELGHLRVEPGDVEPEVNE